MRSLSTISNLVTEGGSSEKGGKKIKKAPLEMLVSSIVQLYEEHQAAGAVGCKVT
jgi:hypothetical protein